MVLSQFKWVCTQINYPLNDGFSAMIYTLNSSVSLFTIFFIIVLILERFGSTLLYNSGLVLLYNSGSQTLQIILHWDLCNFFLIRIP